MALLDHHDVAGEQFVAECLGVPIPDLPDNFAWSKELLGDQQTAAVNFDMCFIHPEKRVVIIELLHCKSRFVSPYTSHPANYWDDNKYKFLKLWEAAKQAGGELYLVNYASADEPGANQVRLIKVEALNFYGVTKETSVNMTRTEFARWLKKLNAECTISDEQVKDLFPGVTLPAGLLNTPSNQIYSERFLMSNARAPEIMDYILTDKDEDPYNHKLEVSPNLARQILLKREMMGNLLIAVHAPHGSKYENNVRVYKVHGLNTDGSVNAESCNITQAEFAAYMQGRNEKCFRSGMKEKDKAPSEEELGIERDGRGRVIHEELGSKELSWSLSPSPATLRYHPAEVPPEKRLYLECTDTERDDILLRGAQADDRGLYIRKGANCKLFKQWLPAAAKIRSQALAM